MLEPLICGGRMGEVRCRHEIEVPLLSEKAAAGAAHQGTENLLGEPVHQWQNSVKFHRKPPVRRGDENGAARQQAAFGYERALPGQRPDVLYNGRRMNDVKSLIAKRQ